MTVLPYTLIHQDVEALLPVTAPPAAAHGDGMPRELKRDARGVGDVGARVVACRRDWPSRLGVRGRLRDAVKPNVTPSASGVVPLSLSPCL